MIQMGGKYLHDFAGNLFGKLCTEFYRSRSSFVADITKIHFGLFFPLAV